MEQPNVRDLLISNVERLMADHPDKDSTDKLAKRCFWPEGNSKAGKPVAPRTIRYALERQKGSPSPSLDLVAAIANAFDVPAWQLLADDRMMKLWQLGKLFTISEAVTDEKVERHLPLPPSAAPSKESAFKRRRRK